MIVPSSFFGRRRRWVPTGLAVVGLVIALAGWGVIGQAAQTGRSFDHDRTVFPLTGKHQTVECEACHVGGRYENLPTECGACHRTPSNHMVDQRTAAASGGCGACHDTTDWLRATFAHPPAMTAHQCSTCHNGQRVRGKPVGHLVTTAECDQCHTTTSFVGVGFRHDPTTTTGKCNTCHNGQTAKGKSTTHVVTTAQCDTCHTSTTAFVGATFRHDPATTANKCNTCHNGQMAPGKSTTHVVTTAQCDTCHTSTTAFVGATFRHDLATTANKCNTCHNGQTAPGKPTGHLATTAQCDQCHRTTGWTPATYANHANPQLIGGHSGLDCKVCHPQSFSSAFYRDGIQFGFCSNCHRRDYKYPGPGDHKNAGTTLAASLQVNANCANCHEHAGYRW